MTLSAMSFSIFGTLKSELSLELVSEDEVSSEELDVELDEVSSEELEVDVDDVSLEELVELVEEVDEVVELLEELLVELEPVPELDD